METKTKNWGARASKQLKKKFKEVKTFKDLDNLRDEYLLNNKIYPKSEKEFFEEFKNENDIWKHDPKFWEDSYWYWIKYLYSHLAEIENPIVYQTIARKHFNDFIEKLNNLKSSLPQIWSKINTETKDFLIKEATFRDIDLHLDIDFESSFRKSINNFLRNLNLLDDYYDERHFDLIKSNQKVIYSPYLLNLSLAGDIFDKFINAINKTGYLYKLKLIAIEVKNIDPKFYEDVQKAINFSNEYIQDKLKLITQFINELFKNLTQIDFTYQLKSLYYLRFMFEDFIDFLKPLYRHRYSEFLDPIHFLKLNLPTVEISYDIPPIFANKPEEWENKEKSINEKKENKEGLFDVEELLGLYIPRENKIILFERGIRWAAKKLSCDVDTLREIVFIHELAHWATHQLPLEHTEIWPLKDYEKTESYVHEGLAQLLCYWTIVSLPHPFDQEYLDAFHKLNKNQSSPYHVYKQFTNYRKNKVIKSIDLMRDLGQPATLNDWKKIVLQIP